MKPAVGELVHRADVQIAERVELLHPAEMEERVAADHTRHVPERDSEGEPEKRNRQRVPRGRARDDTERETEPR